MLARFDKKSATHHIFTSCHSVIIAMHGERNVGTYGRRRDRCQRHDETDRGAAAGAHGLSKHDASLTATSLTLFLKYKE